MGGMDSAMFAFYTEAGKDHTYNLEFEKLTVLDILDLLVEYGYKATTMRVSPTLILINISHTKSVQINYLIHN